MVNSYGMEYAVTVSFSLKVAYMSESKPEHKPAVKSAPAPTQHQDTPNTETVSNEQLPAQALMGNRLMAQNRHLLNRKLGTTSNRAAIQRWPWSKPKNVDLNEVGTRLHYLRMGMDLDYSSFEIENTVSAGETAIANIVKSGNEAHDIEAALKKSVYQSDFDKQRRTESIEEAGIAKDKASNLVNQIKQALPGLRLQETIASPTVQSYAKSTPKGGTVHADPTSKFEQGVKGTGQSAQMAYNVRKGVRAGSMLSDQNSADMIKNTSPDINQVPTSDGGSRGILDTIKSFIDSIQAKMLDIGWIKQIADFLQPLAKFTFLGGAIANAISLYTTWTRYDALKTAKLAEEKDPTSTLAQSLIYGFAKVRRALYWNISKFGLALSKVVSRLITILSGGTSALVTESIALATDLAKVTMFVGRKLKAVYKMIRGTKGKNRQKNASVIYDAALRGDKSALKLFIAIKPFGVLSAVKNKLYIDNIPGDEAGMLSYLHKNESRHAEIQTELADSLKSS